MKVLVTQIRIGDYRDLLIPELAGQQGLVANKVLAGLCNAGDAPGFVKVGPSRFLPIRRCEERVSCITIYTRYVYSTSRSMEKDISGFGQDIKVPI
jgi:hypothetical protein